MAEPVLPPVVVAPKLATPYRDLTKANDLVTKNFPSAHSFAITTETKAGGTTVKSSVKSTEKEGVVGQIEPKYDWKEHNLVFEGTLSTANVFSAKATAKNLGTPGLNFYLKGDRKVASTLAEDKSSVTKVETAATGGVQFNNELAFFVAECKVPLPYQQEVALTSSVHVAPIEQAALGLKLDYTHAEKSVFAYEGKLIGRHENLEGALTYSSKRVAGLHFWHEVNSDFQWAATVAYPLSEKEAANVTVAGAYKLDDFTTVKAKVEAQIDRKAESPSHRFRSGVSLQQKLNLNTTLTVGADINLHQARYGVNDVLLHGADSSCGFELAFK